ncbi:MAG: GNAT family N-acetyltransferase [Lutibacter sp.]|jgi:ElaA protein|nr:GNAT family N-acetyltransferase [Lutibacter sp.]
MTITIKKFSQLSSDELYTLLQLRSAVFVVEQQCVYQDIDDKDKKATHILGFKEDKLVAYTRIFKAGDYFEQASIGRVVVHSEERGKGIGHIIMQASIQAINTQFNTEEIKISAQRYLKGFYQFHGFEQQGSPYLEDGIPHIAMLKQ